MKLLAEDLTCRRGERTVFASVAFALNAGEALLVTGPNGAGKSSLLAILAGLLRPESGRVWLEADDGPPWESINLVGHRDALKGALTAEENLSFAQALLGASSKRPREALEIMGLGDLAPLPAAYLSAGQRRRVALARLLVSARPIWLLDEPTAALDAVSQASLGGLMAAHLGSGGIIIATSHGPLALPGAAELKLGVKLPRERGTERKS